MGSFNVSCCASQQTIAPGDRCFVLPIIQARTYNLVEMKFDGNMHKEFGIAHQTCYPNAFWEPFGSYIEAEYDDYGQVKLVNSPLNCQRLVSFICTLAQSAPQVVEGSNSAHDCAFDLPAFIAENTTALHTMLSGDTLKAEDSSLPDLFDECETVWGYIWEVGQEQRLFAGDARRNLRPLQFAILHGVAYDNLVAMAEKFWDKSEVVNKVLDMAKKYGGHKNLPFEMISWPIETAYRDAVSRIASMESGVYPGENEEVINIAKDFVDGRLSDEETSAALSSVIEPRLITGIMQWLNLRFSPIVYAGQDYSNEIGAAVAKFISKTAKEVSKARKLKDD